MSYIGARQRSDVRHALRVLPERWQRRVRGHVDSMYLNDGYSESVRSYVDYILSTVELPLPLCSTDSDVVAAAEAEARRHQVLNGYSIVLRGAAEAERAQSFRRWRLADPGAARRACPRWWKRQIRQSLAHVTEVSARSFGYVGGGGDRYVSHETHARDVQRRKKNEAAIQAAQIHSEDGEQIGLEACVETSVSNPSVRRAELMTRVRGFEEVAAGLGHRCLFLTCTLPSRFHPVRASGSVNERFDGSSVHAGQKYLSLHWSRFRALLDKRNIRVYGFRVAEPHRSGTVHWHVMLFHDNKDSQVISQLFYRQFTKDAEHGEPIQHRVELKKIDPVKGTAAGYIAKYIAKNIDGENMDESDKSNATRVRSWASVHRIRQFQQFGGARVGVWRELRRVTKDQMMEAGDVHRELYRCVHRSDDVLADWAKYNRMTGSIDPNDKRVDVSLDYVWTDRLNEYSEPVGKRLTGVCVGMTVFPTRQKVWRVRWRMNNKLTMNESRTSFNNCNQRNNQVDRSVGHSFGSVSHSFVLGLQNRSGLVSGVIPNGAS